MRHTYRLFTRASAGKSNLVATYAVAKKEEEEVRKENANNPESQWMRVNRDWRLVR